MSDQWQERIRPVRLERRYEFPDYETLRTFLDSAAEVSEREGLFPDMGFGRDYVNVTIHSDEKTHELGDSQRRLAVAYDELFVSPEQD
jgi:4a-hydroxytetrahydrobiopterin dehydratase